MHETNQPQIKSEKLGRDASVQISGEGLESNNLCINNDLVPRETDEADEKGEALDRGLLIEARRNHPNWEESALPSCAMGSLEAIVCGLTSSKKFDREYSKQRVRDLVKLGKGQ